MRQNRIAANDLNLARGMVAYYNNFKNIPYGWKRCDGNWGVPNLNDGFIAGKYDDSGANMEGWSSINGGGYHFHDIAQDPHGHWLNIYWNYGNSGGYEYYIDYYYEYTSWDYGQVSIDTPNTNLDPPMRVVAPAMCMQQTRSRSMRRARTELFQGNIPVGTIIAFHGLMKSIPRGWKLCDGSFVWRGAGIRDLRNYFIIGAQDDNGCYLNTNWWSGSYNTGGNFYHNHYFNDYGHSHYVPGNLLSPIRDGSDASMVTGHDLDWQYSTYGYTYDAVAVPVYYALYFLVKIFPTVEFLPPGATVMWHGVVSTIPKNFSFCDGTSGTLDLRNKYPKGGSYDSGSTAVDGNGMSSGVGDDHFHYIYDGGHFHTVSWAANSMYSEQGEEYYDILYWAQESTETSYEYSNIDSTTSSTGDITIPQFTALPFMMCLN